MGKFEVGQRIVLTNYLGTVKELKNGAVGTISAKNSQLDLLFVAFDGVYGEIPVYPGEMQPAEHPAPEPEPRGAGVTTVTSDAGITSRAMWVKVDGQDALFVEASAVHAHTSALQVALDAERARVRALEAALKDANEQIIVQQGTLGILVGWFSKAPGFAEADGFTMETMLTLVRHDLDASHMVDASANGGGV